MDKINFSTVYLSYKSLHLRQKIACVCWLLLLSTILLYVTIFHRVLASELDDYGNDINSKYELRPIIDTPQDPRVDGILLGLGLAKTGTTSLYATFCTYSLLNSNCRVNKPEDKYWHQCIWNHFQPENTKDLFEYNISNILHTINHATYEQDCSIDGWGYFSFVYANPRESLYRRRRRKEEFFVWNQTLSNPKKDDAEKENSTGKVRSIYFVRGYHGKTTNHFGSIYIPHILNHALTKSNMNLKFYVIFRNPMSRILSSYIFMVGYEKKYMPKRFADINTFISNDINNEHMINIVKQLNDKTKSIWDLNWEYIFKQWILYEANTRKQCYTDRKYLKSISHQITKDLRAEKEKIPRYQQSDNPPPEYQNFSIRRLQEQDTHVRRIDLRQRRSTKIREMMDKREELHSNENDGKHAPDKERVGYSRVRKIRRERPRVSNGGEGGRAKQERVRIEFTCERDVFRSTVGDSCYIVPLMYWINIFGEDVMVERLKILQFEYLVNKTDEYVQELLCFWDSDTCGIAIGEIQNRRLSRRERIEIERTGKRRKRRSRRRRKRDGPIRIATTFRYQDNKQFPEFIVDESTLNEFNEFFKPCNRRLNELLSDDMHDLMLLDEFNIEHWDFHDS